ncbi:MAG: biotin--[acetyl-CoA-carboxylase] ligase [Bacteroidota bacterium]
MNERDRMLAEQALRKGLRTRAFGSKIFVFDTIDSTNNCAKAVAGCGAAEGTVVIAEQQTEGKGRHGRLWQANPNENLMFSLVLRPKLTPEGLNLLPLYVAVGVAEAIERQTGLKVECKWPNDLLINKKKVAGILIEGSIKKGLVEHVVVGIGINVNQQMFGNDLAHKATSLRLESGKELDRTSIFKEVLLSLEKTYQSSAGTAFQSIVPHWLLHTTMINKNISVSLQGNIISGIVKGLSPEGGLILQSNGDEKTVFAGDVTVLGM